jgi:hypothetical protein
MGKSVSRCRLTVSAANVFSSPEVAVPSSLQKIRDLDSFEEVFWLIEQNLAAYYVLAVEVEGATTVNEWRAALEAVQRRHPLLSASIHKQPGERPYFVRTQGVPIPLRVEAWTDTLVLHEEMEKELNGSFGDGSGSQMLVTLFHGPERSALLFAVNHSPFDGKSGLLIVQDLLASMVGESLGAKLGTPSMSSVMGRREPARYTKTLDGEVVAPEDGLLAGLPRIQVKRLLLDEQETATLIKRAKEEGTTVHSVLIAALSLAGARYSKDWDATAVRCLTNSDVRSQFGISEASGLLFSFYVQRFDAVSDQPFWDKARGAREVFLSGFTEQGVVDAMNELKKAVAEEQTARKFLAAASEASYAHDLMVTNYAGYKVRTEYGRLRVTSLFTGSASSGQKVSVITVNGRLGMTLVSRQPFPTLLEDAREILLRG